MLLRDPFPDIYPACAAPRDMIEFIKRYMALKTIAKL